jgi:hypothetical protein
MDFIIKLPKTGRGNTGIMVVADRLSKMVHFLLIQDGTGVEKVVSTFLLHLTNQSKRGSQSYDIQWHNNSSCS